MKKVDQELYEYDEGLKPKYQTVDNFVPLARDTTSQRGSSSVNSLKRRNAVVDMKAGGNDDEKDGEPGNTKRSSAGARKLTQVSERSSGIPPPVAARNSRSGAPTRLPLKNKHSISTIKPAEPKVQTWTCKGEGSMGCVLPQEKIEGGEGHTKGCVNEKNRDSSKKEHYNADKTRRRLAASRENRPIHRLLREINRAQGQA